MSHWWPQSYKLFCLKRTRYEALPGLPNTSISTADPINQSFEIRFPVPLGSLCQHEAFATTKSFPPYAAPTM